MSKNAIIKVEPVSRPTAPSLRPVLRTMLDSGKRNSLVDGEFAGVSESPNWAPPVIAVAEYKQVVGSDIPTLESHLAPAEKTWINSRVVALLSHYFVPDLPIEVQVAALADWVRLLSIFPQWAIEAAVDEWLSRPGRQKPMPGDIVAGCRWRVAEPALNLKLLRKLADRYELEFLGGRR